MLRARFADGLTVARAVSAPVLAALVAADRHGAAALVLAAAWLSDALDGRLARAARSPTRLGPWDMPADVAVGAGVAAGLGATGAVPTWLAAAAVLGLGGGYLLLRQPALGMALQAIAYAGFLWRLLRAGTPAVAAPAAVALGIAVLERRKLRRVEVPAFLGGIADAARLRRGRSFGLPDDPDRPG